MHAKDIRALTRSFRCFLQCLAVLGFFSALLISCAKPPPTPEALPVKEPVVEVPPPAIELPPLQPVLWETVDGWLQDDPALALGAFQKSCQALRWRPNWQAVCNEANNLAGAPADVVRAFFEQNFVPHRVQSSEGEATGMMTGYYVPDLRGSEQQTPDFSYPLYRRPDDLLVIDLTDIYPDLNNYRLRGRVEGHRVVPYWDRSEIDSAQAPLAGQELFWVSDPVELFFLHIQGSGRILLENGRSIMVNYADQNGHPYRSIGKYLLDRGVMSRDQMSMQNIRQWARQNPEEVDDLLNQNPSYVFFRELDHSYTTPPGALGVPLTPGRSLAVDPRYIPLGAPVFVNTTWPNSSQALTRLMVAQDTGGAIKGPVRGDFFWGMGQDAGRQAGRMKQDVRMWVLLPIGDEEGQ